MIAPEISDVREKERRVRRYLAENEYDAAIIGRLDNFAWFTCGGKNHVVETSETGFGILVITQDTIRVIAHTMDGPRIFDEELQGLDYESVYLSWYDVSREQKASQLVRGLKVISDIAVEGTVFFPDAFTGLHYPLTDREVEKCRQIGVLADTLLFEVAGEIRHGMSELEVEAMVRYLYTKNDMTPEVMLVGCDERIAAYRHTIPTDKRIEKLVLIHPAARKWGLHANITRMVYFGDTLPEEVARKYDAACQVEAAAVSMCVPGTPLYDIIEIEKQMYMETGFEDEWNKHFHGLVTGYALGDSALYRDRNAVVSINQAYDWFVTITGVKVEELSLNTLKGPEIASISGKWPVREYSYQGKAFPMTQILMR